MIPLCFIGSSVSVVAVVLFQVGLLSISYPARFLFLSISTFVLFSFFFCSFERLPLRLFDGDECIMYASMSVLFS